MIYKNFVKYCLSNGGIIIPLAFSSDKQIGTGLCNPSILRIGNKIKIIIRNVNYILSENEVEDRFTDAYGIISYITPDDDNHLRTKNFICDLADNTIDNIVDIDTSKFDTEPQWDFIGTDDLRLINWDNKLYVTGVRRDDNTKGVGRMELSELDSETFQEISRLKIESPYGDKVYCEKNWMPILDMPYHYVRWCNPLEIVKVDPVTGQSEIVVKKEYNQSTENLNFNEMSIRGSSQVITVGDYRMAIVHRCELWVNEKKQKNHARYIENIIVWDKDWNIVKISKPFNFGDFDIEFTVGLMYEDGKYYIPFALQDNIAFILCVGKKTLEDFIFNDYFEISNYDLPNNEIFNFFNNTKDSYVCKDLGDIYYKNQLYAPAMVLYHRAAMFNTFFRLEDCYECMYMVSECLKKAGNRKLHLAKIWASMIDVLPYRSEAYYLLSRYYLDMGCLDEGYIFMNIARRLNNFGDLGEFSNINKFDMDILYIQALYGSERYLECEGYIDKLITTNREAIPNNRLEEIIRLQMAINQAKSNKKRIL